MFDTKTCEIIRIQNMINELDSYLKIVRENIEKIKERNKNKMSENKIKGYRLPVAPQVIDRITNNPYTTPKQKIAMAKKFQAEKLAKLRLRGSIKNAATQLTSDDMALNFMNQNTSGKPYRFVDENSCLQSSISTKTS